MEKKIYSSFQKALAADCLFICGQRDGLAVGEEKGGRRRGRKEGERERERLGEQRCLVSVSCLEPEWLLNGLWRGVIGV